MAAIDSSEPYVRDTSLSFVEKWNRHVEAKRSKGSTAPPFANKWTPYFYFFTWTGGVAWMLFAGIPNQHFRDPIWYLINETFGLYAAMQVMINWYLIKTTDASYQGNSAETDGTDGYASPKTPDHLQTTSETSSSNVDKYWYPHNGDSVNYHVGEISSPPENGSAFTTGEQSSSAEDGYGRPARKTGLTFRMQVATSFKDNQVQRESYPYWSWIPCLWCKRLRPPRCHHCTLCNQCILRRDHHCYFTRACVGANNMRYFFFFLFWTMVLTTLALCETVPYGKEHIFNKMSYWNIVFPVNLINVISGTLPFLYFHFILVMWSVFACLIFSIGMFSMTLFVTLLGLTKFEHKNEIKIVDTRSMPRRLNAIMGKNWWISLLLPGYNNGHVLDDSINWPYIKP